MVDVTVNRRGEERVRLGHLWVYRSDVLRAEGEPGAMVRVVGPRGRAIGYALYSSRSEIALRLFTRGDAPPDLETWRARIEQAVAYRAALAIDATAYRVIHGEADLLPSLIVDRYGDYLVLQTLSQGTDRLLPDITRLLVETLRPAGILARNDPKVRTLEGLEQRVDVVHGEVPDSIRVRDGRVVYGVDPYKGQKTGLFLDQRENRAAAARYAHGRLLDAFSYHGAFALTLAASCEEVTGGRYLRGGRRPDTGERAGQRRDEYRSAGDERVRRAARARTSWRALRRDRARSAGICEEPIGAAESALRLQGNQPPGVEDSPSRRNPDHVHVFVPRERSSILPRSLPQQPSTRTPTSSWSKNGCSHATIRC